MKTFLRENWIWIAAPIAVFALVLAAIFLLADDGVSPFVYDLGR